MKRDLLSMLDVAGNLENIIDDAIKMKKGDYEKCMAGKTMAMIFEKSSTRTRVSFEVGVEKLGGHALFLSKNDIQLGRGESIEDTAKVLSRYVDIIMYRAFSHENVRELALHATIPVINGLDDREHPCQVMADLMTVKEHKGKLAGLKMVYFGDGNNNMAHSLLLGCALVGMKMKIVAPGAFWPDDYYVTKARELGMEVELSEMSDDAAENADVVVTDTWVSMGDEAEKQKRLEIFRGYTVTEEVMKNAKSDAIFMHCLPAYYGYEVTEEVAHGPQSVIFDEAENRMWAQMAIIKWLMGE
ncbi:MAG TPA: ornithine carbamoyltransferase [Thermoplasmatales archaeon]|nr:MAG: ornithine carbamoyltransferase [Thermoplasmata archaeon]HDN51298.1 ornithine carbamoyltransferase [Thermoplasmatales archaeon]